MTLVNESIQFDLPKAVPGSFAQWIHGSVSPKHNTDPEIQVHFYNEQTVIMRQNMAVHYEAPFMFLLFGNQQAILLDTGATRSAEYFPLRQTVDALIEQWLTKYPCPNYSLLVAHTHLHRDHFEGDSQFLNRLNTVIVGKTLAETIAFYGFQNHPQDRVTVDLGGRVLTAIATPGHEEAEVCFYDPYSHLLFSGDILYPGRLYINDWDMFKDSIERLIAFAETYPIEHILGCHIEMSIHPKLDYLIRSNYQPYERPLQMTIVQLYSLRTAIEQIQGSPGIYPFDDYIIYNTVPARYFSFDAIDSNAEPGAVC
jgi:hydroxyacylglutathione hydrolase